MVLNAIIRRDELGVAYGLQPDIGILSTATALGGAPRGIASTVTRSGNYQVFAGTMDKLYKVAANGAVTEIGTGYSVPAGDNWSITQFGDYVYFTNTFDGLLRYNIESGGAVTAVVGAPKGRFIFTLFGTLAMLDCDGNNRLLKTSKINDPTVWSGDASNRYQEFVDGEELIAGGELSQGLAVVFQRNAIRLLSRTRDRSIFTSDQLALGVGAQSPQGCVFARGWAYFIDTDGFHRTNGSLPEPIGRNKVSRTFIKSLASNALQTVEGAFDPEFNRVLWRYQKSDNVSATVFGDILSVDLDTLEWAPIEMDTAAITSMASPGYTLDELDVFGTMETLPYSLDSRVWKGGEPGLAAVNGDFKIGFVSGTTLACTLETASMLTTTRELVRSVTPVTDCTDATIQIAVKERVGDDYTYKSAVAIRDSGNAPIFGSGRVKKLRANIPADSVGTFFRGFDAPQGAALGLI